MRRYARYLIVLLLGIAAGPSAAHPWGGLVVDEKGDIFFTFICPMASDHHTACVWHLPVGSAEPRRVLVSEHDPSDMILMRDADRTIYAAERVGGHPFRTRLWRLSGDDAPVLVLPFMEAAQFSPEAYTVDHEETIYFIHDGALWIRNGSAGDLQPFHATAQLSTILGASALARARHLAFASDGSMYVQYEDKVAVVGAGGGIEIRAASLRDPHPPDLPFNGANILFDMAVAESGTLYLAYYGNREVRRVDASGHVTSILKAEAAWAPHGVDTFAGTVYVLESTTPAPWWQFWRDDVLRPRIRAVDAAGTVTTLYEYPAR